MTARDQHPLSVERFGPARELQRERWHPVPAHVPGLCAQGPTVYLMFLDDAARITKLREAVRAA